MKARGAAAAGVLGILLVALTGGEARGSPGWSWPVEGHVVTPYSNDETNAYAGGVHRGLDIAAAIGTPVRAARAGEVTYAGALGYSGLTVSVRTVDGYVTSYLHLSAVAVRSGETVHGGAPVGEVGTTGRRSKPEPHLHFGVRIAGEEHHYVDPLTLLPPLHGSSPTAPSAPVPAPVPAASEPAPARMRVPATPARTPPLRRPAPRPVRAPVHLPLPAPARLPDPARRPVPAAVFRHRPHPVPVAAARRIRPARIAPHPAPGPAARAQAPAADWGRPLALAGLALVLMALFGRSALVAAGRAVSEIGHAALPRRDRPRNTPGGIQTREDRWKPLLFTR